MVGNGGIRNPLGKYGEKDMPGAAVAESAEIPYSDKRGKGVNQATTAIAKTASASRAKLCV